jgi:hypothetical protein
VSIFLYSTVKKAKIGTDEANILSKKGIKVACVMKIITTGILHLRVLGDLMKESEVGGACGVFGRD